MYKGLNIQPFILQIMNKFKELLKTVDTDNTALLEEILKLVQTGNGLLFVGAGFSSQAININNSEFKLARNLSHEISYAPT